MSKRVHGTGYPVQPRHIDASDHLFGAFDHCETEISAGWIVRLCQELGTWGPFSQTQLDEFYHRRRPKGESFHFNRLIRSGVSYNRGTPYEKGGGWIELDGDGYHVTEDFIARCFKSRPKTN